MARRDETRETTVRRRRPAAAPDGAAPAWPADAVEVGRIGDAWGVQGWFKVNAYASPAEAMRANRTWFLQPATDAARHAIDIDAMKPHGDSWVARGRGVGDRDAAARLRGARVFVPRSCFPPPAEDEYYWADLVGLEVVDGAGGLLGRIAGLLDNGPQAVLRIERDGTGGETLIPFVGAHVRDVDLAARRVVVDWTDPE